MEISIEDLLEIIENKKRELKHSIKQNKYSSLARDKIKEYLEKLEKEKQSLLKESKHNE